jgi:hypothetical protein
LYQTPIRAKHLDEKDLGFTAELEKENIGAWPIGVFGFFHLNNHFNSTVYDSVV